METIPAAKNDSLTAFKTHDVNVETSTTVISDENQENSVDNRQCQSHGIRTNSRKLCNRLQTDQQQICACDQNCFELTAATAVMANATNGLNWSTSMNSIVPSTMTMTDPIKSNGFHHISNKENTISMMHTNDDMDICDYTEQKIYDTHLTNLCDATRDGTLDAMVSSDLDDTEITLADKKCTNEFMFTDNCMVEQLQPIQSNEFNHVIDKGHRRTRARSESDHCDSYETRKQRMRREAAPYESNSLEIGSDDCLTQSNATGRTIYVKVPRGKSLSPPKIGSTRSPFNRNLQQRHITRPFHILRKQKFLQKVRQQASKLSSPRHSPTAMGKSIPKEISIQTVEQPNAEKTHPNGDDGSESEYSSLEDDDDVQEAHESDENDFSDTDENNRCDNKAIYNSYKGSIENDINHSMLADSVQGQYVEKGPLAPSLFPNVPPYITFVTHAEKGSPMPADIKKVLKWKLTTITPIVIRKVILNSGFRLLKQTNDWMGTWGKHMKSPCFRTLRSYQKINHIPGSFQIGRKDRIWRNLQTQMARNGRKDFDFMPMSYILPQDGKRLKRLWPQYAQKNTKWIIKPPASARGTGIKVVNKWKQIPKRKPIIVQKYIERPLLIDGSKFDLRLYVLVTSMNPLRAYMHTDGLARFASVKYSNDIDTLNDRYMHLTNYSINKLSSNYAKNEDADSCNGHKWTLKTLWKYFQMRDINTDGLWAALRSCVLRTILTGEHVINQMAKANVNSKYNTFELFGIDVILDSELKPWLLEVNISPSLHSSSPLDLHVKGPLVTALLNTVLYNVPPRFNSSEQSDLLSELGLSGQNLCFDRRLHVTNLCKGERLKHNRFTNKSIITEREQYLDAILEHLTPDDIRCLIKTEDELARCAPLERICPTPNSYRFIKFTDTPRYYNRLLDAWEHRYAKKRHEGIEVLRKFCENRIHMIIPATSPKINVIRTTSQTQTEPIDERNSDNETGEIVEQIIRSEIRKTEQEPTVKTNTKLTDESKSPIPLTDEQLNESSIDQHDILVTSIA